MTGDCDALPESNPSTQIPVGPAPGETGTWDVSLAEIDALGRKAARGAGFEWGLAEEAGRAARWLAAYRLPGPEALLHALRIVDGATAAHAPQPDRADWQAEVAPLCPIATGAALSDRARDIAGGAERPLAPVAVPLLLVPFLCRAARDLNVTLILSSAETPVVATPDGPVAPDLDWLSGDSAEDLRVTAGHGTPGGAMRPCADPWPVAVETWRALDRLAYRTYAPASESSRAGAGAGTRDND